MFELAVTVFTPTYNRAYIIGHLYESLLRQTFPNFEWLVIDDGSTDNTEEVIQSFIEENKIQIRYFKQPNGGKHRAINHGVQKARGELFFIVDSDDYLTDNALKRVMYHYENIKTDKFFVGVCGLRADKNNCRIGGEVHFSILDCNSFDFRYKYRVKGDMAEVVRTDVLKKYSFPDIENEKFCAEGYVWNKIAQHYKFRYFYEKIYICEYLTDGLTAKSVRLRMRNCNTAMLLYSDLYKMDVPFRIKIKAAINYWRFAFCSSLCFTAKSKQIGIISFLVIPISVFLHLRDYKEYIRK